MSDTPPDSPTPNVTEAMMPQPSIRVLAQYVRDLSFENPNAPNSLVGEGAPKIDLEVELNASRMDTQQYQLELKLTVRATRGDQTAFHVELVYGGVFAIENVPDEAIEGVLLVECPRYLFPFARQIVANITADGGFPPFRMEPLDFGAIYMARQAQAAGNA